MGSLRNDKEGDGFLCSDGDSLLCRWRRSVAVEVAIVLVRLWRFQVAGGVLEVAGATGVHTSMRSKGLGNPPHPSTAGPL